jgi:4-amino-4-deoxy-L-arabinose transferase-like glycosyltransferase
MTWRQRILFALPVLLPLAILIGTGYRGLDFGRHWDEDETHINPLKYMVRNKTFLPHYYQYPSVNHWLSLAGLIPAAIEELCGTPADASAEDTESPAASPLQARLLTAIDGEPFRLRLRFIFLLVSSLAVLWVYLLVAAWRRSWLEATLAASFVALSWEMAYHFRYTAPDGVLAQFGALTLLGAFLGRSRPRGRGWLRLAAVAAGLGCGSKYPGGLLLVPVLVAGYQAWARGSPRLGLVRLGAVLAELTLVFGLAYLVSTPGTVLEPETFLNDIRYVMTQYAGRSAEYADGYRVPAGLSHAWYNLVYLSSTLFSYFAWAALVVFGLSLVGAVALLREDRGAALLLFVFPVLYVAYFSTQEYFVVKNLLVVAPFLAVAAARGAAALWALLGRTRFPLLVSREACKVNYAQAGLAALLLAVCTVNAGWLAYTCQTIAERGSPRFLRETAAYLSANGQTQFFLSARVRKELGMLGIDRPLNTTEDLEKADAVVFYTVEGSWPADYADWRETHNAKKTHWPATRRNLVTTWFGPYETNLNYYPSWEGDQRLIVMPLEKARQIGAYQNLASRIRHENYSQSLVRIREVVATILPPDATVIVASQGDKRILKLDGRTAWHFPQDEDGAYTDDEFDNRQLIAHLEALRAKGGRFLLFPGPALWWLELKDYRGFQRHLETHYRVMARQENVYVILAPR